MVVGDESSVTNQVISGVPQGSVLGPLLFLVYINDVTRAIEGNGQLSLYADDILLYQEIKCSGAYLLMQDNMNAVHDWFSSKFVF